MKKIRKLLVSVAIIGLALAVSGTVFYTLLKGRPQPQRAAALERTPLVDALLLAEQTQREVIRGFGTARADVQAILTAEVNAPVLELVNDLEEGMSVTQGEELVILDDSEYAQQLREAQAEVQATDAKLAQIEVEQQNQEALLQIAEADLKLNQNELQRVLGLYESGQAPKKELDDARLMYQSAQRAKQTLENQLALLEPRRQQVRAEQSAALARVERAKLNMQRCRITAPFDGQVASLSVEVGERVRVGSEFCRVVSLEMIEIPVELPVSTYDRVQVGAEVGLNLESMPGSGWVGKVARKAPVADQASRTYKVYVEVDNSVQAGPALLPGYFVQAQVDGQLFERALVVPRSAVIDGQVFVLNDELAHRREVKIERYLGEEVVLAEGVQPGERVITTNLDILYDNAPVRLRGAGPVSESDTSTAGLEPSSEAGTDSSAYPDRLDSNKEGA